MLYTQQFSGIYFVKQQKQQRQPIQGLEICQKKWPSHSFDAMRGICASFFVPIRKGCLKADFGKLRSLINHFFQKGFSLCRLTPQKSFDLT